MRWPRSILPSPMPMTTPTCSTSSSKPMPDSAPRSGTISIEGLHDVNESFVRKAALPIVHSGDRYSPSKIEAARQALAETNVFSGVGVRAGDHLDPDGSISTHLHDMQERPMHAVGLTTRPIPPIWSSVSLSATLVAPPICSAMGTTQSVTQPETGPAAAPPVRSATI